MQSPKTRGVGYPKIHAAALTNPSSLATAWRRIAATCGGGLAKQSSTAEQCSFNEQQQTAQNLAAASVGFKLLQRSQLVPKTKGVHSMGPLFRGPMSLLLAPAFVFIKWARVVLHPDD